MSFSSLFFKLVSFIDVFIFLTCKILPAFIITLDTTASRTLHESWCRDVPTVDETWVYRENCGSSASVPLVESLDVSESLGLNEMTYSDKHNSFYMGSATGYDRV
jgi:hypothetical protein